MEVNVTIQTHANGQAARGNSGRRLPEVDSFPVRPEGACDCFVESSEGRNTLVFCELHTAAPALLEACQLVLRLLTQYDFPGLVVREFETNLISIDKARQVLAAAIAQAEGGVWSIDLDVGGG